MNLRFPPVTLPPFIFILAAAIAFCGCAVETTEVAPLADGGFNLAALQCFTKAQTLAGADECAELDGYASEAWKVRRPFIDLESARWDNPEFTSDAEFTALAEKTKREHLDSIAACHAAYPGFGTCAGEVAKAAKAKGDSVGGTLRVAHTKACLRKLRAESADLINGDSGAAQ